MIVDLSAPNITLDLAGGKGANLARLKRAGFGVPPGFILTTDAYREYVAANGLSAAIAAHSAGLAAGDAGQLEQAAARIRAAFAAGTMPAETARAIRQAYAALGAPVKSGSALPVAVRSSATTEDLPELSFAGQQDTFLNVAGAGEVLAAVVNCWSSLWTARAIGYRLRNAIPREAAALAVVVQAMVPSDVSGVLFTANPLTGLRSEMVIDAVFGLGEALVSGQVEPDHFVVEARSGRIVSAARGAKQVVTRAKPGGGVETISASAGGQATLGERELGQLAAAGRAIEAEYGAPQDVEWAFAGGQLYLLQSRAITTLFPVPRVSFDPLIIWFSFAAVQGLLDPVTPLGQDGIRLILTSAAKLFGQERDPNEVDYLAVAGERLWIKISDVMRHPLGSRILGSLLEFVEPSVGQILRPLAADPRVGAGTGRLKFSTVWRVARAGLPVLPRLAYNLLRPAAARAGLDQAVDRYLRAAQVAPAQDRFGRLAAATAFMRQHLANVLANLLPRFIPVLGPGMAGLNLLDHLAAEDPSLALEVTRGLPGNVTTEMDLALWEAAKAIRADGEAAAVFSAGEAQELAAAYRQGALPGAAQAAIGRFMERYGMRGVGEIDIGQPRWREDPAPVVQTLKSYLRIDPAQAPDVLFARGAEAAQAAVEAIAAALRRQPGGWLKERLARAAARRVRLLLGARESPKFLAIRVMGRARQALLEAGREFAQAGTIERAEDLAFLRLVELEALADEGRPSVEEPAVARPPGGWKRLIEARRLLYERERRRRQAPRVLVSDGRAFYEGLGGASDSGDTLTGSPVSPGVAEGTVHVVLDPRMAQLAPGEILVCPGTDPAWTPLFMAAGGLITEVGGMMTHGSVVAREYGIPAVVGVHQATLRLRTGQRIRLDGTQGKIIVLEPEEAAGPPAGD